MRKFAFYDNENKKTVIPVGIPTKCPHCDVASHFVYIYGYKTPMSSALFMRCPSCGHFICLELDSNDISWKMYPHAIFQYDLPEEISNLSPRFVKTYCQSMQAILNSQDELVGLGLRKALELLVFDYLKNQNIEISEKTTLSQAIEKLDTTFKSTAQVASWIGNDSAHYFERNQDLSIEQMVKYVKTVAYHINANLIDHETADIVKSKTKR